MARPGIGFTSASCSAYRIMNGDTTPCVSAGSNNVGASEKCHAHVTCPSGEANTPAGTSNTTAIKPAITDRACPRDGLVMKPSFAVQGQCLGMYMASDE